MNESLLFVLAFNQGASLADVVQRIPRELLDDPRNEVLVIDDGSADDTFFIAEALRERLGEQVRLVILKNPAEQGSGGNQKLGYRYAIDQGFQRVVVLHGDARQEPERAADMLAACSGPDAADVVVATGEAANGATAALRVPGEKLRRALQNAFLGTTLTGTLSGYRAYTTRFLAGVPFERNANDDRFDAEVMVQALAVGARIAELPARGDERPGSTRARRWRPVWRTMVASLHMRLQRMGFLYDRKFDLEPPVHAYDWKSSPYSTHSRIADGVAENARVLDVGCGSGVLAERLVAKGCTVDGVDQLDPSAVSFMLHRYWQIDLNKERERLAEVLAAEDYDVVVLGDVVEHLIDPEGFLDLVRSSLRSGRPTRLLVSTGNVAFVVVRLMLLLGQFNYAPRGILDRTHTRLFTRASMRKLLEQAGFRVLRRESVPLPFTLALPRSRRLALFLERTNRVLARMRHGLFAFQLIYEVEPLPTTAHLLDRTRAHSRKLREQPPLAPRSRTA